MVKELSSIPASSFRQTVQEASGYMNDVRALDLRSADLVDRASMLRASTAIATTDLAKTLVATNLQVLPSRTDFTPITLREVGFVLTAAGAGSLSGQTTEVLRSRAWSDSPPNSHSCGSATR